MMPVFHYPGKTCCFLSMIQAQASDRLCSRFNDVYGYGLESTWVPDIMGKFENVPMSFRDRVTNTFYSAYWYWDRYNYMYPEFERIMTAAFNRQDIPSYFELERNASLVFVNTHHSYAFANSLPPFVIPIGGMNVFLPEKEIPKVMTFTLPLVNCLYPTDK